MRDSGVGFVTSDIPEANDLTGGILALVAQQERKAVSWRTKEALPAARTRGAELGSPNGAAKLRGAGKGSSALRAAVSKNSDAFAQALNQVIGTIKSAGRTTLGVMAAGLYAPLSVEAEVDMFGQRETSSGGSKQSPTSENAIDR